jgi:hypothetical protein
LPDAPAVAVAPPEPAGAPLVPVPPLPFTPPLPVAPPLLTLPPLGDVPWLLELPPVCPPDPAVFPFEPDWQPIIAPATTSGKVSINLDGLSSPLAFRLRRAWPDFAGIGWANLWRLVMKRLLLGRRQWFGAKPMLANAGNDRKVVAVSGNGSGKGRLVFAPFLAVLAAHRVSQSAPLADTVAANGCDHCAVRDVEEPREDDPFPSGASAVTTFNKAVPGVVKQRTDAGKHVIFVDQFADFSTSDLGSDHVHPNEGGYEKMAVVWYAAIKSYLH